MCSASQTAFSIFSDQLLASANLRKIQFFIREANLLKALSRPIWPSYLGKMRHELGSYTTLVKVIGLSPD
jgi:hypothetical protein